MADGWATGRKLVGSNEFWILGPPEDPARIAGATDAADAFRRIQDTGATFVSRGGPILANPYHTLYLTEPTAGAATARKFGEYLASGKVQALLREFGRDRYGEPMDNDAATTARMVGD